MSRRIHTLTRLADLKRKVDRSLVQERIERDIDDGVKVNHLKIGEALATISGLAPKKEK